MGSANNRADRFYIFQLFGAVKSLQIWFKSPTDDLSNLDEQTLHAGANVWLGEERTGGFHPEYSVQHPEPLLQQVGRVSLQAVQPLSRHYLYTTIQKTSIIFTYYCMYYIFLLDKVQHFQGQSPGGFVCHLHEQCC